MLNGSAGTRAVHVGGLVSNRCAIGQQDAFTSVSKATFKANVCTCAAAILTDLAIRQFSPSSLCQLMRRRWRASRHDDTQHVRSDNRRSNTELR